MSPDEVDKVIGMKRVTVLFTIEEFDKLKKLADLRNTSVAHILRQFAIACQPGGSGWKHPHIAAKEYYKDKEGD